MDKQGPERVWIQHPEQWNVSGVGIEYRRADLAQIPDELLAQGKRAIATYVDVNYGDNIKAMTLYNALSEILAALQGDQT